MKTRVIGDVHGHKYELELILDNLPSDVSEVIQVGDLGVGFGRSDYWHESLDDKFQSVSGCWIRGNHDNPSVCKEMKTWIPDGTIVNDWMFIGGAWSIDRAYRTEDVNWWKDEELSYEELYNLIDIYQFVQPSVMITHDVAKSVATKLFFGPGRPLEGTLQFDTRTAHALETMFSAHRPKLNIFGHWHYDMDEVIDGTRFICLNELSYCDVDRETLEVEFPPYFNLRKE